MRQGAEEHHGYVASELFKLSSHRSPVDLFEFFNLYIEMVSKASGIQPYFLGGGVCVCVCCMYARAVRGLKDTDIKALFQIY